MTSKNNPHSTGPAGKRGGGKKSNPKDRLQNMSNKQRKEFLRNNKDLGPPDTNKKENSIEVTVDAATDFGTVQI